MRVVDQGSGALTAMQRGGGETDTTQVASPTGHVLQVSHYKGQWPVAARGGCGGEAPCLLLRPYPAGLQHADSLGLVPLSAEPESLGWVRRRLQLEQRRLHVGIDQHLVGLSGYKELLPFEPALNESSVVRV